jgi:hypothetical protein
MAIMVLILKFTGSPNIYFFLSVSTIISLINMIVYRLTYKICSNFFNNKKTSLFISSLTTIFNLQVTRSGMEVTITILIAYLIIYYCIANKDNLYQERKIIFLGFLFSILILSRIDSIFFAIVFLVTPSFMNYNSIKNSTRRLLSFSLGGALLPIYLISNLIFFKILLPISGNIKHLKNDFVFNQIVIGSFMSMRPQRIFIIPTFLGILLSVPIILRKPRQYFTDLKYSILVLPILFLLIYLAILSFSSYWTVWEWYSYPAVIASTSVLIILLDYIVPRFDIINRNQSVIFYIFTVLLVVYSMIFTAKLMNYTPDKNSIYIASKKIADFEKNHSGIYAMGDRAGTPAYLMKSPLIQLEGLVMDKKFMEHIRLSRNLNEVLIDYNVDYYIATNPRKIGGVYNFTEPAQAPDDPHKMRGQLVADPVFEFVVNGICTAIFKLK